MNRYEEQIEHFLSLMADDRTHEDSVESPSEYLFQLWHSNRHSFSHVIQSSLNYIKSFRGLDECIISVCLGIGRETRDIIEAVAFKYETDSEWGSKFHMAAIMLGSTRSMENFRKCFEEMLSKGIRYYYNYKEYEVLNSLETIAFIRLIYMRDLVARLAVMRDEQEHRIRHPLFGVIPAKLMAERHKRKQYYLDSEVIKLAEAINVYFTQGVVGLKEYLNTKGDSEYRASKYLFCLACDRNPDNYEYFLQQYQYHKDPLVKKVCIEAIIYASDPTKAASFLDDQLGRYDLQHLIEKAGHDFKIITIRAHELQFYFLLTACYYLRNLNEGLINKLTILSKAREGITSTSARVILRKNRIAKLDKNKNDLNQELLLKTLPSPAHLLSMARSLGKL